MREASRSSPTVLLVMGDEAASARVAESVGACQCVAERVVAAVAVDLVAHGKCRIVLFDARGGFAPYVDRLKTTGAIPIFIGERSAELPQDIECVARPSELMVALVRSQSRLLAVDAANIDVINRISQTIATQFTMPELVQVAIAKTREFCEADGASLLLVDPSTGDLIFDHVEGGAREQIQQIRLPRGRGIAGKVAQTARPMLVQNVEHHPDFDRSADEASGFHTKSVIAAPLMVGGSVIGVLMGVRSIDSPSFVSQQIDRLVQLAPHVAVAVHNVQMTSALRSSRAEVMQINASLELKVRERTEQIAKSKQEWERTFDAISEPIALMDGFTVRRANVAYAKMAGLRVQEVPGQTCHKVLAGRSTPCPNCPLVLGRGAELTGEIALAAERDGKARSLRFSAYWMSDDRGDRSMVLTYLDVTESRVLEERVRESERLAAIGQLASGAAHEINNPLGFVTSNLRNLRGVLDEMRSHLGALSDAALMAKEKRIEDLIEFLSGQPEPDLQSLDDGVEMIDESLDGTRRVGDIVKGLRELSRLEIGKREPADLNASITRVVRAELGENAPNVTLDLKATTYGDIAPLQLDQALGHILKNAKQATPNKQRITIRSFNDGASVAVQIADEGAGIPKENLRRVFEPFFTTRGVGKGIGLGLTAAYGIIKRVGGDIDVESDGPGKGATFTVRLPVIVPAALSQVA